VKDSWLREFYLLVNNKSLLPKEVFFFNNILAAYRTGKIKLENNCKKKKEIAPVKVSVHDVVTT